MFQWPLFCILNKAAGINYDHVGSVYVICYLKAVVRKLRQHNFTVNLVLGTAERYHTDFLLIKLTHSLSRCNQNDSFSMLSNAARISEYE